MGVLKAALIIVGSLMLAFIVAGVVFAHLRFFLWIGIIGLIIWAIYALVTRPWRYS